MNKNAPDGMASGGHRQGWLAFMRRLVRRPTRDLPQFRHPVKHVWIVQERHNATVDYLVLPAVRKFNVPVEYFFLEDAPPASRLNKGVLVVLVRYVNANWRQLLTQHRASLAGIVYFMDDDLLDPQVQQGLPPGYLKKIGRLVGRHALWLKECSSEVWVSTDYLTQKYASLKPRQVRWQPPPLLLAQSEPVRLCYHGSGSHADEQRWLLPVVRGALEACPSLHFEIVGDLSVNRLFRDLPRVTVLHPMSWPNYLAFAGASRRDIGLAPLLPGPFNAARGPTKFFDLARMGAVGIYSDVAPYNGFVRDGVDGLLIANDPDQWIAAIRALVHDRQRLENLASAARLRAVEISEESA
ncbi:MAG: glycosyltransferase [Alcaligenaceae bacterium]|nr:MAG: glycosyltransferase [Alcaligenaceae bacterium]